MVLPELSRRTFLAGIAATGVVAACSSDDSESSEPAGDISVPVIDGDPFTLGVASGDPTASAVILWTRLAPDPTAADGGMPAEPAPVGWEVATDEDFTTVVAEGQATTGPDVAHSVHVDADGLEPSTIYWYRFSVGDQQSPVGRTSTMPAPGETPERFTIAQVSCQRWDQGEFAAYRDIAEDDVDLVIHCGDYIYERPISGGDPVRPTVPEPAITLDDYRAAYGLYKGDAHLQAAHAAAPWAVTWDDHEVSNNYVGETPSDDSESATIDELLERRAAGYQAWWEHMPVRLDPPDGPDLDIFHRIEIGDLARVHMLDTRQYRTFLGCEAPSSLGPRCDASIDPATTVLGAEQESWLTDGLAEEGPVWDVVAQQILVHQWRFSEGENDGWNLDQWDGYPVARTRLLQALAGAAGQPVVLTGDVHSSWVAEMRADFDDPSSDRVGTEFVVPGISSNSSDLLAAVAPTLRELNDHIVFDEQVHTGWLRHEVTADEWTAAYRYVDDFADPDSTVSDGAGFVLTPEGVLTQTG